MFKITDLIDGALIATGFVYSLENIEHTLGILILVIQIIWLIAKLVYKFITIIKEKRDPSELDNDVDSTVGTLEDLKDKLEEMKDNADKSDKQK